MYIYEYKILPFNNLKKLTVPSNFISEVVQEQEKTKQAGVLLVPVA